MYARALTCSPRPDPSTTSPPLSPAVDFHICVSGARSIGDLPLLTRRHGDATGEASSVTVMKRLSIRGLLAGARRTRHAVAAKATTSVPALVALLFFFAAATFSVFSLGSFRSPGAGAGDCAAACDAALARGRGEWVRDAGAAPYYTNATCGFIQDYQNCMKHGRPSMEFLRWRWRPGAGGEGCEPLGPFDAARFFRLVRGRSMLFVGDSLASSHVTSLVCALSQVEAPARSRDAAAGLERWRFPAHGFAVAYFWTPFQVRWRLMRGPPEAVGPERQGEVFAGPSDLHLDEPDERWTSAAKSHDYVVLSASHWFARPAVYYQHGRVVGCHDCGGDDNATAAAIVKKPEHAQRAAFRAVLGALARLDGFNGTAILRTVAPTHYENGGWFDGGECTATRPVNESEDGAAAPEMAATEAEFYRAQVEEFAAAAAARRGNGGGARARLRLMDVTRMMLLRPDGHPDRHGHGGGEHDGFEIDCLHWCLPGAIDVWNDLLLHIIASS
ncbi:protein trichome birefringence-like 19 [Oryza glaberrima]|nr:protein trichome birefringence-like 19 [Oryza glaberrima]